MYRRSFMVLVSAAASCPLVVRAQQQRVPVIGYLSGVSPGSYTAMLQAFRRGLREEGYVEGENVRIEYRWAEGQYDRLTRLAADLVKEKVDVIAASGGPRSAPAAKAATATIPIVFVTGIDPVAAGLVASLARPGGNVTGFTLLVAELMEKRLELLSEMVPQTKSVAVLINPTNSNSKGLVKDLPKAAEAKGLQLHVLKASTESEIDAAFAGVAQLPARALVAGSDAFFNSRRNQITALAARYRVPAIYDTPAFTAAGGLMAYGPSLADAYTHLGVYAGKVLKGAKPADLPVQQPIRLQLIINLKTAKALGLTVPRSLLARADEVID
jgi:putative ABC transport system substrate-binding protein